MIKETTSEEEYEARLVEQLYDWIAREDLDHETLQAAVTQAKLRAAAVINRSGIRAQLWCLIEFYGSEHNIKEVLRSLRSP